MDIDTQDAPTIDRTEAVTTGATVRLRAASKRTLSAGWTPDSITVEYTGPVDTMPGHLFYANTVDLHQEIDEACRRMNEREGRS